jgi:ketosteroid isomerase-like protein
MLTPQEVLVAFLTDSEDRLQYLADDVDYRLPRSLWEGVAGRHVGKPAVSKMLTGILTDFYDESTIDPEVHMLFGTDEHATAVFTMRASTAWGEPYENDYIITVKCKDGRIVEVFEVLDTKNLFDTVEVSNVA